MSAVGGLGRVFDVVPGFTPVNLATAANTGARVHMKNYGAVAIVLYKAVGGAGEAPTIVVQEHDAATSGNSQDLDVVTTFYKKEEATLDGDETWTKVTQTAGDITDATWDDANEVLVVAEVTADDLDLADGFEWVSANVADVGTTAQVGALLYIPYDLRVQRAPENLVNPNA